jgi:hypothetical protein
MSSSTTQNLAQYGTEIWSTYSQQIKDNMNVQAQTIANLNVKNQELIEKQRIQVQQLKEIEDKEKLLLTRARMLQISQDRNAYKKKIIYTLIAVIFAIFILCLVMYVLFTRKGSMA